jgi:hypothetical protein
MGENGESPLVNEGRKTEFVGIINYAVIAVLLSRRGAELNRLDAGALIELYDGAAGEAFALMLDKTHDYSDAWLKLEHTTFTDFILARVGRMKRMIKSGAPAGDLTEQLMDTLNYAAFAILREKGEETGV